MLDNNLRRSSIRRSSIWFIEKNVRGAWVIHGCIGIRQYYYYTKKEAIRRYRNEVLETKCVLGKSVIYL